MSPGPDGSAPHNDRPNIVLLTAHDMGRYLGCYGRQAYTPHLDALAADGARFEEAFAVTPSCAPSRACVQTGLLTHNNGMFGHPGEGQPHNPGREHWKGWAIHEGIRTLPMYLNERGYHTHLACHTHATWPPHRLGVQHVHEHGSTSSASDVAETMSRVLRDEIGGDEPFYLQAATANAHRGDWSDPDRFDSAPPDDYHGPTPAEIDLPDHVPDTDAAMEGFDEATMREHLATMYRSIHELDTAVGRIVDTLETQGLREETLFVFTVDHGINEVPRGKFKPYDPGIEIATLMNYPNGVEACRPDELVSNVDILPTILELVDGRPPVDIDGCSHRPLIDARDDREYTPREHVVIEQTWHGFYDPIRGIRTEDHKFLRNFWPVDSDNTARDLLTESELYDLDADPAEVDNVVDDPAYANIREDLYGRLRSKLERDNAPILDGPIAPVPGVFDIEI